MKIRHPKFPTLTHDVPADAADRWIAQGWIADAPPTPPEPVEPEPESAPAEGTKTRRRK